MKKFAIILLAITSCGAGDMPGSEINVLDHLAPPYTMSCEDCEPYTMLKVANYWNNGSGMDLLVPVESGGFIQFREVPAVPGENEGWANLYEDMCDVQIEQGHLDRRPLLAHEVGHCLGFDHSSNSTSIMWHEPNDRSEITEGIVEILDELILDCKDPDRGLAVRSQNVCP